MATKLIFVHGRSQEGRDPAAILKEWKDALTIGLGKRAESFFDKVEVKLPFYGDVLDQYAQQLDESIPADIVVRGEGGVTDTEYKEFVSEICKLVQENLQITGEQLAALATADVLHRGPENWGWVQALLQAADAIPGISAYSIQRVTRDVYIYLSRSKVRGHINRIVEDAIKNQGPVVVVGHSLGSVVGYDVLRSNADLEVSSYITIGSPLGVGPIMRVLRPINYPSRVRKWFNAYDDRDVVALNPLDTKYFPVQGGTVENYDKVRNRTDNAHGISGYLSDSLVGDRLFEAVMAATTP
ncbi:hypothetical protein [Agrobacterium tumefaciens]|uniref:hypothetical protein n=1 Tax=Agrobacterium tumefaciens TaxID=358 RepID=UPI0027849A73|nr:hypothetical protein [Agrobacterium tumefaciens]MDP9788995.1 pimeloyl-ACP methyl ester carboxylesterase [Agrobacterium tumefaciens]